MRVIIFVLMILLPVFGCGSDTDSGPTSCERDRDCSGSEMICIEGVCQPCDGLQSQTCVDEDGDGYGANRCDVARQSCPRCENPNDACIAEQNCCVRDPDDTDPDVVP